MRAVLDDDDVAEPTESRWLIAARELLVAVAAFAAAWLMLRIVVRAGTVGDLVAIATPYIAVLGFVAAVVCSVFRRRRMAWLSAAVLLCCIWQVASPRRPSPTVPPVEPVRVVAANLRWDNPVVGRAVDDVIARDADVVVVSELVKRADRQLEEMYEHSAIDQGAAFSQGVYSRFPLEVLDRPAGLGENVVKVRVGAPTPFVLFAVHLPRPTLLGSPDRGMVSFSTHRGMVRRLDRLVAGETMPAVIAGDLNMSDRTTVYDELVGGRLDTGRVGQWADSTFTPGPWWSRWSWLRLRIDYIVAPGAWCAADAASFQIDGSDHRGVTTDIGACPPQPTK